ncbi:hypothetical protein JCM11641_000451 [Rhodosporidiobolus odoratus]
MNSLFRENLPKRQRKPQLTEPLSNEAIHCYGLRQIRRFEEQDVYYSNAIDLFVEERMLAKDDMLRYKKDGILSRLNDAVCKNLIGRIDGSEWPRTLLNEEFANVANFFRPKNDHADLCTFLADAHTTSITFSSTFSTPEKRAEFRASCDASPFFANGCNFFTLRDMQVLDEARWILAALDSGFLEYALEEDESEDSDEDNDENCDWQKAIEELEQAEEEEKDDEEEPWSEGGLQDEQDEE